MMGDQMRGGKVLAAWRAAVVVTLVLSLCTAEQTVSPPTARAETSPAPDITVGWGHACAIVSGPAYYCWGSNTFGELSNPASGSSSTPVPVIIPAGNPMEGKTLVQITAGKYVTCALDSGGVAYCWGRGFEGELGNGAFSSSSVPVAVSMPSGVTFTMLSAASAGYHVCALDQNGHAWCWGKNDQGQLGDGTTTSRSVPVQVMSGASTPLSNLTQIAAGGDGDSTTSSTCALDNAGHAYCWGSNDHGQVGNNTGGTAGDRSLYAVAVYGTTQSGGVVYGKTLKQITVGLGFACALDSAGVAYCWGANAWGQLGNGTSGANSLVPVQVAQGAVPSPYTLTQITAGEDFACAIASDGHAYCWGSMANGRLGNNANLQVAQPTPVPVITAPANGSELPADAVLTQIDAGLAWACAMDAAGGVYCWGSNYGGGGLGNGSGSSGVPVEIFFPPPQVLSLTCPDSADLGEGTPGSSASGSIGPCTVDDSRTSGAGTWTVTVASTNFTYTGVTPNYVIPATAATYTIPPGSITGVTGTAPNNPASGGLTFTAAGSGPPGNPVTVLTGEPPTYTVTWNPTLTIAIPASAAITTGTGVYTGTITTSVLG